MLKNVYQCLPAFAVGSWSPTPSVQGAFCESQKSLVLMVERYRWPGSWLNKRETWKHKLPEGGHKEVADKKGTVKEDQLSNDRGKVGRKRMEKNDLLYRVEGFGYLVTVLFIFVDITECECSIKYSQQVSWMTYTPTISVDCV